jgi:hypothetical protein
MKTKGLFPLLCGLAVLSVPVSAAPDTTLSAEGFLGSAPSGFEGPAQSYAVDPALAYTTDQAPLDLTSNVSANESFTYVSFDTLPLFTVELPPVEAPVHVELVLEESVVGLRSVDGVGVMLAW